MRKSAVQSNGFPLAALAVMLSLLLGASSALGRCPQVGGSSVDAVSWHLTANGWSFRMDLFQSGPQFWGWLDDRTRIINGILICHEDGRTADIYFDRDAPDFVQHYRGIVDGPAHMHGQFDHNYTGSYSWEAETPYR
jgi:hypothetical protein